MIKRRTTLACGIIAGLIFSLSACATTGIEGSRHTLYETTGAISADSGAVVVGIVGEQSVVESDVSYTVSTFKVEKTVSPASLGSGLRDGASSIASGQTIEVRQIGSSGMDTTPAPLLEVGKEYLLFLTPTMLPDEPEASQFFITGGDAGLYRVDGDAFTKVVTDSGDTLPTRLSPSDLK